MDVRVSEEEMVTVLSVAFPIMEEQPLSGSIAVETGQPMQGVQTTQNLEASKLLASQSPQLEQTPSPIRTVFPQTLSSKETLGGMPLSKQTGNPYFPL